MAAAARAPMLLPDGSVKGLTLSTLLTSQQMRDLSRALIDSSSTTAIATTERGSEAKAST
jgi:hypothetical protein